MPYHGAALQAYLCSKWAKDNGYIYDPNSDVFISVANGYEVAVPLPDDNRDVLATYYQGCGLLKLDVRKSSIPKPYGKAKRCKTAEEAVTELTSSPDKKSKSKRKSNDTATDANKKPPDNCTVQIEDETALGNSSLNITVQDTPDNCTDIKVVSDADYAGDRDLITGEDGKLHGCVIAVKSSNLTFKK